MTDVSFLFNRHRIQSIISSRVTLIAVLSFVVLTSVGLWYQNSIQGGFGILYWNHPEVRSFAPRLRAKAFNLTDFGGVGDGVTVNTKAFQRAVAAIERLAMKGGGQLNVQKGLWLTAPFNLTSHMTLFLEEEAVILGHEVRMFSLFCNFFSLSLFFL